MRVCVCVCVCVCVFARICISIYINLCNKFHMLSFKISSITTAERERKFSEHPLKFKQLSVTLCLEGLMSLWPHKFARPSGSYYCLQQITIPRIPSPFVQDLLLTFWVFRLASELSLAAPTIPAVYISETSVPTYYHNCTTWISAVDTAMSSARTAARICLLLQSLLLSTNVCCH